MNRHSHAILLGLAALFAMVSYFPVLTYEPSAPATESAIEGFFFEPAQTSAQIVYAVALTFFFSRSRWIAAALRAGDRSGARAGLTLLASAAGLLAWSAHTSALDLRILSLVLAMLGTALLLGGGRTLRAVLRPTLFLLFAIPLPAVLVNQLAVPMQFATADLARNMLGLMGIGVEQRADLLFSRGHVFQVIETCNGLRFVVTLAMAAVAYAELFGLHGLHAALLIALSPLLAFLLNGVRVLTIVLTAGTPIGTEDHTVQGLVMIVIGVFLLVPVDALLRRCIPAQLRAKRRENPPQPDAPPVPIWRVAATAGVLGATALAGWLVVPWSPPVGLPAWGVPLPRAWGDYQSTALTIDPKFLGSVQYSKRLARAYELGEERVEVFMGYDDLTERLQSPFSPRLPYPESGWHTTETAPVQLDGFPQPVWSTELEQGSKSVLSYTWYEGARPPWVEAVRAITGASRSILHDPVGVTAVRLTTPVTSGTGGIDGARQRLARFATELRPMILDANQRIQTAAGTKPASAS